MQKKRRRSIWLLPIIAFIGTIGFLAHVDSEPYERKIKKPKIRDFRKVAEPDNDLVETQVITDLEELQLTAS